MIPRRGRAGGAGAAAVAALAASALFFGLETRPAEARTGETLGIVPPPVTPVDVPDAWAWDVNASAAAFHDSWSVVAAGAFRSAGLSYGAAGAAGLVTVPVAFGLVAGGGLEILRAAPVLDGAGMELRGAAPYVRLTLGLAYELGDRVGLGVVLHHFFSERAPFAGVTTWDAGATIRLSPAVALAATVTDIGTPTYDDPLVSPDPLKTERSWMLALGLRPVHRLSALTLTAGARLDEPGAAGELAVTPFANVDWRTRTGVTLRFGAELPLDTPAEPRLFAGVEFGIGRISAGGALHGAVPPAGASIDTLAWGSLLYGTYSGRPVGPALREDRIVELSLAGTLVELRGARGLLGGESGRTHLEMLLALDKAARDPRVKVLVIRTAGGLKMGMAQLDELAAAFDRVRAAGKKIYCFANGAGTRTVALCAHADRFVVSPPADVQLRGLSSEILFYRGAFDKLGVEPEFIRIGEYKSSPEAYTEKEPTLPNRVARDATMSALYDDLLRHLSGGLGMSVERARKLVDEGPYTPVRAMAAGIVHDVAYWDDFKKRVNATHPGLRWEVGTGARPRAIDWPSDRAVAVLVVEGAITDGKSGVDPLSGERTAGAATIVKAIREIRDSSRYAAVVLRISSPGGSALASDLMWKELVELAERKTLIVSMGDIAASGGYYIAAAGAKIFLSPGTITGSIGIFTGKFSLAGLATWAGIHVETFKRGERADLYSLSRPLTVEERAFALETLRYYYDQFLDRVSKGRKMDVEAVDKIARGRVWTGLKAKELGLADEVGGLWEALVAARKAAGLPERTMPVDVFPKPPMDLVSQALRFIGIGRAGAEAAGGEARDAGEVTVVAAPALDPLGPIGPALRAVWPMWAIYAPGTPLALWEDGDAFVPAE